MHGVDYLCLEARRAMRGSSCLEDVVQLKRIRHQFSALILKIEEIFVLIRPRYLTSRANHSYSS